MVDWKNHKKFLGVMSVFVLAQIVIIGLKWGKPLVWDSTVYVGMGKYIYSLGEIGYWENFRPPLLPMIIGALWRLGVPMANAPRILALIFSVTGVTAVYKMVSEYYGDKLGLYTALVIISTYTFFWWTPYLLTGIPASILVFSVVYMIQKQKYVLSGILTSAAFLMRFPATLIAVAIGFYFFSETFSRIRLSGTENIVQESKNLFHKGLKYGLGFATLSLPYFAINQYFLGNFLYPIVKGATVPAGNPDKYIFGLYFLYNGVKANPLLALAPIAFGIALYQREKIFYLPAISLTLFYSFFTFYPHKEVRFILAFLPFMALFAAKGLKLVEQEVTSRYRFEYFTYIVITISILAIAVSAGYTFNQNNWSNEQRQQYLGQSANFSGTVASNTPNMVPYGDFSFIPIRPETIEEDFTEAERKTDYYMINSCSWYCTPAIESCRPKIDNFTETIKQRHNLIFEIGIDECTYSIYKVN